MEIEEIKIEKVENKNLGFADKPFYFLRSILNGHYFPEKLNIGHDFNDNGKCSNNIKFIDNRYKIGNEGAKVIGEALMKNNSLVSLNLSIFFMIVDFWISNLIEGNKIGDEGVKVIGEALMKNNSLNLLNLGIFFMIVDFESLI